MSQKEHHNALAQQSNTEGRGDNDAQHRSDKKTSYAMREHDEANKGVIKL